MINSPSQQPPTTMVSSTPTKLAKLKNKEKKRRKKKKRPPHKSKMITGYIIYASEIRKDVIKKYPDKDFGDISKLVGIEWKNLPQETKVAYEKKAQEQNVKSKLLAAEEKFKMEKLAAEDQAKVEAAALNQSATDQHHSQHQQLPTNCNGFTLNGHSQPISDQQQIGSPALALSHSPMQQPMQQYNGCQQHQQSTPQRDRPNNAMQQQPPIQIIQHQQHQPATTVQYCSNNLSAQQQPYDSPQQYQRNNIVYRKPTTVRLKPKDATTQTESIRWVANVPKKPLKFSQKFMDYLLENNNRSIV